MNWDYVIKINEQYTETPILDEQLESPFRVQLYQKYREYSRGTFKNLTTKITYYLDSEEEVKEVFREVVVDYLGFDCEITAISNNKVIDLINI